MTLASLVVSTHWLTSTVHYQNHYAVTEGTSLLDFVFFTTDLKQKHSGKNCSRNTIDLCYSNIHSLDVSKSDTHLVRPDKCNPPLHVSSLYSPQFIRCL